MQMTIQEKQDLIEAHSACVTHWGNAKRQAALGQKFAASISMEAYMDAEENFKMMLEEI